MALDGVGDDAAHGVGVAAGAEQPVELLGTEQVGEDLAVQLDEQVTDVAAERDAQRGAETRHQEDQL